MSEARMHRFEVWPREDVGDPKGNGVRRGAHGMGIRAERVRTARVYLIHGALSEAQGERIRRGLLENPVLERSVVGASEARAGAQVIEVHPLPGVMDPAAQTVRDAVNELTGVAAEVVTGWRYEVEGVSEADAARLAKGLLANEVIEQVHTSAWWPDGFPAAARADQRVRHIAVRNLDDGALERLSREGHLFLSLDEMQRIRAEYQRLSREPTDIELETLAQTWSEHCVHKTLKSTVRYRGPNDDSIDWRNRPGVEIGADGVVTIHNLLKSTVAAATFELIKEGVDWTISVFKDNAGIIRFDGDSAVCVKVETHNHPSAIEPYGGAATGAGGVIRDIIGTGLGARPIAMTDVFCVAGVEGWGEGSRDQGIKGSSSERILPKGCLHPKRVLARVVEGVGDYGNRMGIPTVNGAVWFDDRYIGNPLVFCGCVGVIPERLSHGAARPGDAIVAIGGRTGRDGIHGATFSSAELTDTHADEFSHAVQIGNAVEEKRTLEAILRARDEAGGPLYSAITDCGAGGFSSAVGEMGAEVGATVDLEKAPLKYAGLRYDEIWISESQERMLVAVPPANIERLRKICAEEGAEMAVLGTFGTEKKELVLRFEGNEVGRMSMEFLHEGIPMPVRSATWSGSEESRGTPLPSPAATPSPARGEGGGDGAHHHAEGVVESSRGGGGGAHHHAEGVVESSRGWSPRHPRNASASTPSSSSSSSSYSSVRDRLLSLLAHPNIASKRRIVRVYDHEVQGGTVIRPLVGPGGEGPGDAAVIQPVLGSKKGLAIGCGLAIPEGDPLLSGDPYRMAIAAVDECVRNLVCVGADPDRIAILDNFCWPSCAKPQNMGTLVRAAVGCYDAAKAYRTPFVSGKDSLNNQFRTEDGTVIEIPPTLLITGIGVVEDVSRCVTSDMKEPTSGGDRLLLVTPLANRWDGQNSVQNNVKAARAVAAVIKEGLVRAAHDCSEGGLLVAIAEMLIGASGENGTSGVGADVWIEGVAGGQSVHHRAFFEQPGMYVIQVSNRDELRVKDLIWSLGADVSFCGYVTRSRNMVLEHGMHSEDVAVAVSSLAAAFTGTLDW